MKLLWEQFRVTERLDEAPELVACVAVCVSMSPIIYCIILCNFMCVQAIYSLGRPGMSWYVLACVGMACSLGNLYWCRPV